ncbi:hypothetical protein MCOR25_006431 [Pyricularia grisea]|uniref:CID domain-containing protein n=1 Tax=Pyricularia grisea TaxID=148305 RepID=A0A6P8B6Z8_PYRGI|nr:hypothetical protein PgNI_05955 [Pyricularia grisea]KAI6361688.1 hypothetical protein MCOR25_006431 [Pyricularia grisea]TLD10899.1 hypothetical protein PgNI_05955 [Pyricularia grisea]
MAYTDDAVLAKLSALNESHDSIATAAQWIMFHRRHADRTVQLWLGRLKESPSSKRLNLVYLANEVTQQSKARHRDDFVNAFSPIIAEAAAVAYKGASSDVQNKLRRVIDVWKDRNIFEPAIQAAIEARLEDLDKAKGIPKSSSFGASGLSGSGGSVPSELSALVAPQQNVSKQQLPMKSAISAANQDYERLTNPANPVPTAPVYAARLNGLLKTLATAEGAVAECVKARKELIGALEKMLDSNREALRADEAQLVELSSRRQAIDAKKSDVEMAIMSGLSMQDNSVPLGGAPDGPPAPDPAQPQVEALTPPSAGADGDMYDNSDSFAPPPPEPVPATEQPTGAQPMASGIEMLSNIASQYHSVPTNGNTNKRRRVESGEEFPDLGKDDGIDPDVKEMLSNDIKTEAA